MEIKLRIQESGKRKEVFPLLAKCFPEYWAPRVEAGETKFSFPVVSVIAECNGIVCGHCGIYIFEFYLKGKTQKAAGLCAVAVDPDCRGMGIAGKMCDHVIEYCRSKEIFFSPLYTGVPKVYEKRGWQPYGLSTPKELCLSDNNFYAVFKNDLNRNEQDIIRKLYSEGFTFDGKVKRSDLSWQSLFNNKSLYWCLRDNAYALAVKDGGSHILCEAYSADNNWDGLLTGKVLLHLPSTHPLLQSLPLLNSNVDIWHEEIAMVNIIDAGAADATGLTKVIEENSLFFPLPDKF